MDRIRDRNQNVERWLEELDDYRESEDPDNFTPHSEVLRKFK